MSKLLVVDDLEFFLILVKSLLSDRGCTILTATNSEDAFTLIEDERPSLILLDQYMPGMNGDEMCRKIKNTPSTRDIPVIILTASNKKSDIDKCFDAGCDDYMTKPINKDSFLDSVAKYLPIVKRAFDRVPIYESVKYYSDDMEHSGRIHIIGKGGACLTGDRMLPIGALVKLNFSIAKIHSNVDIIGKVVWTSNRGENSSSLPSGPEEMGIQFINVNGQASRAIVRYIALGNHNKSTEPDDRIDARY